MTTPFRVDVLTIFPQAVAGFAEVALLGRARREGIVDLRVWDLRDGAEDERRTVDDAPFGGGAGMVMMAPPLFRAVEEIEGLARPLLLLSPRGRRFDQEMAEELAASGEGFSLLCGRYEGVDERVAEHLCDGEVSVGDVVLAGGEIGALLVIEAVTRLLPGALGNESSSVEESFRGGLLEYPQYTRPATFRGWPVPEVLRSGDHGAVARWRHREAVERTMRTRPDLVETRGGLTEDEKRLLGDRG